MERSGDTIYFDESEQQAGPKISESILASEAPRVFEEICGHKTMYGRKLQDIAVTEAYDDQTAILLANAKTHLILRHRKLELMADKLVEIAGAEIIKGTQVTSQ